MAYHTDPRNPPHTPLPGEPAHHRHIHRYGNGGRTGLVAGGVALALLVLLFVLGGIFGSNAPVPADGTAPTAPAAVGTVPAEPGAVAPVLPAEPVPVPVD
jgi:hypothetical protein